MHQRVLEALKKHLSEHGVQFKKNKIRQSDVDKVKKLLDHDWDIQVRKIVEPELLAYLKEKLPKLKFEKQPPKRHREYENVYFIKAPGQDFWLVTTAGDFSLSDSEYGPKDSWDMWGKGYELNTKGADELVKEVLKVSSPKFTQAEKLAREYRNQPPGHLYHSDEPGEPDVDVYKSLPAWDKNSDESYGQSAYLWKFEDGSHLLTLYSAEDQGKGEDRPEESWEYLPNISKADAEKKLSSWKFNKSDVSKIVKALS